MVFGYSFWCLLHWTWLKHTASCWSHDGTRPKKLAQNPSCWLFFTLPKYISWTSGPRNLSYLNPHAQGLNTKDECYNNGHYWIHSWVLLFRTLIPVPDWQWQLEVLVVLNLWSQEEWVLSILHAFTVGLLNRMFFTKVQQASFAELSHHSVSPAPSPDSCFLPSASAILTSWARYNNFITPGPGQYLGFNSDTGVSWSIYPSQHLEISKVSTRRFHSWGSFFSEKPSAPTEPWSLTPASKLDVYIWLHQPHFPAPYCSWWITSH